VTPLLKAWAAGDGAAGDQLVPILYEEFHVLAHRYMAGEQTDGTLQTTALVNEVRLVDVRRMGCTDRPHFFAVCAQLMRRVLVDVARARTAAKRGGQALVELRFFGGLDINETAAALAVSPQTVQRDWRLAKVWLFRELSGGDPSGA
jgi:hypothetical protein